MAKSGKQADYNLRARYIRALKKTPKNRKLINQLKGDNIHNQIAALDAAWRKQ